MSTIKNSVGRQSSTVYRRRRLAVGFGLLAVLVIVILIIVRPGASDGEPGGATSPTISGTATDAPSKKTADPPAAVDGAPCDAANVQVEAITDAVNYDPGQLPQLSLSITNSGKNSCVLNAGTSNQVFTVTSGKDVYWTSTDCQTDPVDAQVTLEPGVPLSSAPPISWERVRSSTETCDSATRDAAPAGGASYHLTVSVDGIESATPKQFLLY